MQYGLESLHLSEGDPLITSWPSCTGTSIAPIHGVLVRASTNSVLVIDIPDSICCDLNPAASVSLGESAFIDFGGCGSGLEVPFLVSKVRVEVSWDYWLAGCLWWVGDGLRDGESC